MKKKLIILLFCFLYSVNQIDALDFSFQKIELGANYQINNIETEFNNFWKQNFAIEFFIAIPFSWGRLETACEYTDFVSKSDDIPSFNALYMNMKYGKKINYFRNCSLEPGFNFGWFLFLENTEFKKMYNIMAFNESEFAMGLYIKNKVKFKNIEISAGLIYKNIFCYHDIEMINFTFGVSYYFNAPKKIIRIITNE